jgi:hypothetical protein
MISKLELEVEAFRQLAGEGAAVLKSYDSFLKATPAARPKLAQELAYYSEKAGYPADPKDHKQVKEAAQNALGTRYYNGSFVFLGSYLKGNLDTILELEPENPARPVALSGLVLGVSEFGSKFAKSVKPGKEIKRILKEAKTYEALIEGNADDKTVGTLVIGLTGSYIDMINKPIQDELVDLEKAYKKKTKDAEYKARKSVLKKQLVSSHEKKDYAAGIKQTITNHIDSKFVRAQLVQQYVPVVNRVIEDGKSELGEYLKAIGAAAFVKSKTSDLEGNFERFRGLAGLYETLTNLGKETQRKLAPLFG